MEGRTYGARVAALLMASGVLVGCGGGDAAPVCSDVDTLRVSVDDLQNVEPSRAGLEKLKGDLTQVKSDLTQVRATAEQQYAPETEALEHAYATLSADLPAAASSPSPATIAAVVSDVRALGASLTALENAVRDTC